MGYNNSYLTIMRSQGPSYETFFVVIVTCTLFLGLASLCPPIQLDYKDWLGVAVIFDKMGQ